MNRRLCLLSLVLCLAAVAWAENPQVTKIVTHFSGPRITAEDPLAKKKTIYRAEKKYARVEEEPSASGVVQNLYITNEPDFWIINLADKSGKHLIDEGPTFETRVPIFWGLDGKPDRDFGDLEYGQEFIFFSKERSREAGLSRIDGRACRALALKTDEREVIMYVDVATERPVRIDLVTWDRIEQSVHYDVYETGLPFEAALFKPPQGVKITEAR